MIRMNICELYGDSEHEVYININKMIHEYMLDLVDTVLFGAENVYTQKGQENLGYFLKDGFVPRWMDKKEAFETFKGLYCLVNSDKEDLLPTLRMEYLLAHIIEEACYLEQEFCGFEDRGFSEEAKKKLIEDVRKAQEEFKAEIGDDDDMSDFDEEEIKDAVYMAEHFSPLMFEYLFDDCDYELLDKYRDTDLIGTELNRNLGIVNENEEYSKYTVSDNWLEAKDFSFTIEERTSICGK